MTTVVSAFRIVTSLSQRNAPDYRRRVSKMTNRMLAVVWLVGIALLVLGLLVDRLGIVLVVAGFVLAALASVTYRLRRLRAFSERAPKRGNF